MPPTRSYADLMASRPPPSTSTSSSPPAAVRRPITRASPPRTRPLTREPYGSATANADAATSSPSSLSIIAESPRRLLSYYLSKAAYNTDESEAAHAQHVDGYEDNVFDGAVTPFEDGGDDTSTVQQQHRQEHLQPEPTTPSRSRPLRPPPFAHSAVFSKGLRAMPTPAPVLSPASSPRQVRQAPAPWTRSRASAEKRVNFSLSTEPAGDASMEAAPPAFFPAAREASRAVVAGVDDNPNTQRADASAPSLPLQPRISVLQRTSAPSLAPYAAVTEEEQRQFEADVIDQVDALLQAQRSEARAEAEAFRIAAQEAQATLTTIEDALAEQLGSGAAAVARFAAVAPLPLSASTAPPVRLPSAPVLSSPPSHPSPAVADVERLAVDMLRVAEASTPAATQRLLDAIMGIHDGQDVPAVLRHVVRGLYEELARALVPPVVDFVHASCSEQRQQQQQQQLVSSPHHSSGGERSVLQQTTDRGEALLEAQAFILALEEEVAMLRRTLEARLSSGCVVPSATKPTSPVASTAPARESVRQALLDRFFSECHASLTRSRQESVALRHALEEERRRHFLTRIRLLNPTSAAKGPTASSASSASPTAVVVPAPQRQGSAASPAPRSSTASRERPSVSPPLSLSGPPVAAAASPPTTMVERSSVHRWTPAPSPMPLAASTVEEERNEERDGENDSGGVVYGDESSGDAVKSDGPASAPSQARRLASSEDRPARPPTSHSAARVADAVMRSTAGRSGGAETLPEHPYDARRRPGAANHRDVPALQENAAERVRPPSRVLGGPTITFSDAPMSTSRAADGTSRLRGDVSTMSTAYARAADAATDALGPQPNSEYEKRVWNKAVELLSRYSVA